MTEADSPFPPAQRDLSEEEVLSLFILETTYNSLLRDTSSVINVFLARPKFAQVHEIKGCPTISMGIDVPFGVGVRKEYLQKTVNYIMGDNQPLPLVVLTPRTF